jgi:hypothetical protein
MLYQAEDRALLLVVAPGLCCPDGSLLDEAALAALSRRVGGVVPDRGPIEQVRVVFIDMGEAQSFLQSCKQHGVGCRAIQAGKESVLFEATRVQRRSSEDATPQGTLLPILREAAWPNIGEVVSRRLLPGDLEVGPFVTFGWDRPDSVSRFTTNFLDGRTIADVERDAIENLIALDLRPNLFAEGAVGMPGEYASETLLVPSLMRACAELIGAELMVVAVPKAGRLVAVSATNHDLVSRVVGNARVQFEEAQGRRISPIPFLVQDGEVRGLVTNDTAPASTKKPWWKFF